MITIHQIILSLGLLLALSAPAIAQHSGPYVGGFIGGSALMASKASDSKGDFRLQFDPGLTGSAVAGWDFETGNTIGEGRIELEYTRRSNPLKQAKFSDGSVPGSGNLTADSLLLNFFGVLRDDSPWAPYAGLGVGAARLDASNLQVTGSPFASGSTYVFAYQLGAGLDVALTERISLDLGYRFFSSTRPKFTESTGETFKMDYYSHNAVLGFRFGF